MTDEALTISSESTHLLKNYLMKSEIIINSQIFYPKDNYRRSSGACQQDSKELYL
jgi:hypothetical protein